jgi:hypothetical protein
MKEVPLQVAGEAVQEGLAGLLDLVKLLLKSWVAIFIEGTLHINILPTVEGAYSTVLHSACPK